MTSAEIALALFALCNSVRVFAYVPQIIAVARDPGGASAISYTTWGLFAISHVSTVAYAVMVVDDWRMVAVFTANALCCMLIVALTAWKRALFAAAQKLVANGKHPVLHNHAPAKQSNDEPELDWPSTAARPRYRVVAGSKDLAIGLR